MELADKIIICKTIEELKELELPIVEDINNFKKHQKLYIKQENKIKRHGGE